MDVTLSLLALFALSPVLVVIAIAIKATSDGPVFFMQARVGQGGKLFSIFKFRTMYTDRCDASGTVQTTPDDSRVTPLGRVLRAKSIDELPQILNVLKGDMAIIGPRPHVREMLVDGEAYDVLVPYYDMRTSVRPGLSGWAQVNGYRGPTTDRRSAVARIEHDLAYIAHRSVWLDIRIIVLTIWYEVIKGNAN